MQRKSNTLVEIIDQYTGEPVHFSKVTTLPNGDAITDADCDGTIYRKYGSEYFKRNYTSYVNVRWFGAKGDYDPSAGTGTDDTAAISAALAYVNMTGETLISDRGKKYKITSDIAIDCLNKGRFTVDFNYASIYLFDCYLKLHVDDNTAFKTTTLTADMRRGDTYISVTDATGVEIGDLIEIESPAITSNAIPVSQYYVINDINGNDLYIHNYVVSDVTAQQIVDDGVAGSIVVNFKKLSQDVTIKNLKIISDKVWESCVFILNQDNLIIENVSIDNPSRFGIYIQYGGRDRVINCDFSKHGYVQYDQGYFNDPGSPGGFSYGYGLIHARNAESWVENCRGSYGWHTFDAARGQTFITYQNCRTIKDAYGFSTHEGSWDVRYINCNVIGGNGHTHRCVYLTIKGGIIRTSLLNGIGGAAVSETVIDGATIDMVSDGSTGSGVYVPAIVTRGAGAKSLNRKQTFIFRNNTILNASARNYIAAEVCEIENNIFKNQSGKYTGLSVLASSDCTIDNNTFYDVLGQFALGITTYPGQNVRVLNNKVLGSYENTASAALIFFDGTGDNTTTVNIIGNKGNSGVYLFRQVTAGLAITIANIRANRDYSSLAIADANIIINNVDGNLGTNPITISGGGTISTRKANNASNSFKTFGNSVSAPSAAAVGEGYIYGNTQTGMPQISNGTAWISLTKAGTSTVSGTGQTTINIAHGLGQTPTFTNVVAKSADARTAGIASWTENSINIVVTLSNAAAAGVNNIVIAWEARA